MVLAPPLAIKPTRRWIQVACETCGDVFFARLRSRRFCTHCGLERQREKARLRTREQYRTDPLFRARQRNWRFSNPEGWKASQKKYRRRACLSCGERRIRPSGLAHNQPFVCRACQTDERRANWPTRPCKVCEQAVTRRPSAMKLTKATYCEQCFGLELRMGAEFGLTRERVRQLGNKELLRLLLLRDGTNYTLRDALDNVREQRNGTD